MLFNTFFNSHNVERINANYMRGFITAREAYKALAEELERYNLEWDIQIYYSITGKIDKRKLNSYNKKFPYNPITIELT